MIATSRADLGGDLAHQRGAVDVVLAVPCEKLRRTTSTPARIMRSSTSGSLEAGPSVATILVDRNMFRP